MSYSDNDSYYGYLEEEYPGLSYVNPRSTYSGSYYEDSLYNAIVNDEPIDINDPNITYRFLDAALYRDIDWLTLLLDHGVDVHVKNNIGESAMSLAIEYGSIDIVTFLITHGFDVNMTHQYNMTPLHFAVINNNIEICQLLISKGANVDVIDTNNHTPLYKAAILGLEMISKLLLDHEANMMIPCILGKTPYMVAKQSGYWRTAKLIKTYMLTITTVPLQYVILKRYLDVQSVDKIIMLNLSDVFKEKYVTWRMKSLNISL